MRMFQFVSGKIQELSILAINVKSESLNIEVFPWAIFEIFLVSILIIINRLDINLLHEIMIEL